MPEENKLGTTVTYLDPNKKNKPVRVAGVSLLPNESVDLAEVLPQGRAEQVAKQLAANPYFQVEGGPDHSGELDDRQAKAFDHEQKVQETYRRQQERNRRVDPEEQQPEPPADLQTPEEATLENEPAPRSRKRS